MVQVCQQRPALVVNHLRPDGHLDADVGSSLSELILAAPVLAALGANDFAESKIEEGRHPVVCLEDHASTAAPIAPGGASKRHKLFASKRDATVAAVASHDFERHLVDEVHARPYVEAFAGATDLVLEQIS